MKVTFTYKEMFATLEAQRACAEFLVGVGEKKGAEHLLRIDRVGATLESLVEGLKHDFPEGKFVKYTKTSIEITFPEGKVIKAVTALTALIRAVTPAVTAIFNIIDGLQPVLKLKMGDYKKAILDLRKEVCGK